MTTMDCALDAVAELFASLVAEHEIPGCALVVCLRGETVLELAAGPGWSCDSLVDVASVSKAATSVSLLALVEDGAVDLGAPVASYWPEFAQAGKAAVTVRQLLTHEAGVVGIRSPLLPGDVWLHWDEMIRWLERETPWWPPGTVHGYHPYTFGHLVGEVVRRVSRRSLGTFFAERVGQPFGIDFFIGLPPAADSRVIDLVRLPVVDGPDRDRNSLNQQLNNPVDPGVDFRNSAQWRRAEIPATNGHASARGVARLAALLAGGGELDGQRLLSAELVGEAGHAQTRGKDVVADNNAQYGLGFSVFGENAFGSQGGFGSCLYVNSELGLGVGYVQNAGLPEHDSALPARQLIKAAVRAAAVPSTRR